MRVGRRRRPYANSSVAAEEPSGCSPCVPIVRVFERVLSFLEVDCHNLEREREMTTELTFHLPFSSGNVVWIARRLINRLPAQEWSRRAGRRPALCWGIVEGCTGSKFSYARGLYLGRIESGEAQKQYTQRDSHSPQSLFMSIVASCWKGALKDGRRMDRCCSFFGNAPISGTRAPAPAFLENLLERFGLLNKRSRNGWLKVLLVSRTQTFLSSSQRVLLSEGPPLRGSSSQRVLLSEGPPLRGSSSQRVLLSEGPPLRGSSSQRVLLSEGPPLRGSSSPPLRGSSSQRVLLSEGPPLRGSSSQRVLLSEGPPLRGSSSQRVLLSEGPPLRGSSSQRVLLSEGPPLRGSSSQRVLLSEGPPLRGSSSQRVLLSEGPPLRGSSSQRVLLSEGPPLRGSSSQRVLLSEGPPLRGSSSQKFFRSAFRFRSLLL